MNQSATTNALDTIAQSIGPVPRVLLRDTGPGEAPGPVVRPDGDANRSSRYRIDGEIARGGMGAVLKGRDSDLGRDVAIKVLLEDLRDNANIVRRFVEEAQIGGQLQHPGIVPIYELGTLNDRRPFFAMKLVKGHTWAQMLAARPEPSADLPRFLSIFEAVCQTMAYAHTRGVIHRDLKPPNVMVGSFGEVQVMDWGLAKVLPRVGVVVEDAATVREREETVISTARSADETEPPHAATVMGGTPSYMAPEQARGEIDQVDERADVFALGSILSEILTGSPAFNGRSSGEILRKAALGDTADALARLDACGADPELIRLAKTCLAREREDRPHDASAVAERITAYLTGVQERLRKAELTSVEERARRRLTTVVAAGVLTLTALGGGGWMWVKVERDARQLAVTRDVNDALNQAIGLRVRAVSAATGGAALFAQAREQAQRASALVENGPADAALKEQVRRVQVELDEQEQDRRLIDALDAARLAQAETLSENCFATERAVPLFREAFRAYGLAAGQGEPDAAAERIRQRPPAVQEAVIAALDEWIYLASSPNLRIDEPHRAWLGAVAWAAQPADDWTRKFRAVVAEPDAAKRRDSLVKLAAEVDVRNHSPRTLTRLAKRMSFVDPAGEQSLQAAERTKLELLRRAQQQYPADFWINHDLGMGLRGSKSTPREKEEAVRFLTAAVALRPESPGAYLNLGGALKAIGKVDEAIACYKKAIEIEPMYAAAHCDLGSAIQDAGQIDNAIACYKKAIELEPKDAMARLNLGMAQSKKGQIDDAIASYKKTIELEPMYAMAHCELGLALKHKGQIDNAIASYKKAIELEPMYAMARLNLGAALCDDKRDYDGAIACFRKAIELDSKDATAHFNLGNAHSNKGQFDDAIDCYKQAIELDPTFARTHNGLGAALCDGKGDYDSAIACFRKAVELDPKYAQAHRNLGNAHSDKGQFDDAIDCYKKAIELDSKDATAHCELGNAQFSKGQINEAIACFRKALELDPMLAGAHNGLGAALCDGKRDYDSAIACFRKAVELDPKDAQAHRNLGNAHSNKGQFDDAVACYKKAVELGNEAARPKLVRAERMVATQEKFTDFLSGRYKPTTNEERLGLAAFCQAKKRNHAAAQLYADAFAADPVLAEDLKSSHRYNAACFASLAASGQGEDGAGLDDAERFRLRKQALDWLRADLGLWAKQLAGGPPSDRGAVQQTMTHWQRDGDLASLRKADALAKLPEAERKEWQALWGDVADLLKRAEGQTP